MQNSTILSDSASIFGAPCDLADLGITATRDGWTFRNALTGHDVGIASTGFIDSADPIITFKPLAGDRGPLLLVPSLAAIGAAIRYGVRIDVAMIADPGVLLTRSTLPDCLQGRQVLAFYGMPYRFDDVGLVRDALDRVGSTFRNLTPITLPIEWDAATFAQVSENCDRPRETATTPAPDPLNGLGIIDFDTFEAEFCGDSPIPALIPTGIENLDRILGGGQAEGVTVLYGHTGIGKTMLASQMADSIAMSGRTVLYFALEPTPRSLLLNAVQRFSMGETGKDFIDRLTPDQRRRYVDGYRAAIGDRLRVFSWSDMFTDGGPDFIQADWIAGIVKEWMTTGSPPIVFVDHLHRMVNPDSARASIQWAMSTLDRMASEYRIPVFVISEVSREAGNDVLTLSAGAESSAIEYRASRVLALEPNGIAKAHKVGKLNARYAEYRGQDAPIATITVLKARDPFADVNRPCYLTFDKKRCRFTSRPAPGSDDVKDTGNSDDQPPMSGESVAPLASTRKKRPARAREGNSGENGQDDASDASKRNDTAHFEPPEPPEKVESGESGESVDSSTDAPAAPYLAPDSSASDASDDDPSQSVGSAASRARDGQPSRWAISGISDKPPRRSAEGIGDADGRG